MCLLLGPSSAEACSCGPTPNALEAFDAAKAAELKFAFPFCRRAKD